VLVAAFAASVASGASHPAKADVRPEFTTQGGVAPQFLQNATTIPHWSCQYTDPTNNVTYPITMVGSDPRGGGSTTVHTVIVPLKMNFVAGNQNTSALNDLGYTGFRATPLNHPFDGSTRVGDVLAPPILGQSYTTPAITPPAI